MADETTISPQIRKTANGSRTTSRERLKHLWRVIHEGAVAILGGIGAVTTIDNFVQGWPHYQSLLQQGLFVVITTVLYWLYLIRSRK